MNIWYFSHYAGGPGVGVAMRAYCLAKQWAAIGVSTTIFVARNHHLSFSDRPLPDEFTADSVKYVSLPARPYRGNGLARIVNMADFCRSMWNLKHDDRPDAIITSSPHVFSIFPARRLAKRHRAKLVFEVRDLWPLSLTEIAGANRLHPFVLMAAAAERFAYAKSDVVASLLGNAEPHMAKKGLAPGKFIHVPNGIDFDEPHPVEPTSEVGLAASKQIDSWHERGMKIVIHPGSQGTPNNLSLLLDAARLLKNKPFGFLLVGSGIETERLKAMSADLPNVSFFPRVPKSEALWLTQRSDIGYAGGRNLPIYRFGTSFNKVADFLRFGMPFVELVPTGAGFLADDSRTAIASEIRRAAKDDLPTGYAGVRDKLDYKTIARDYITSITTLPQ